MRIILVLSTLVFITAAKAQTVLPGSYLNNTYGGNFARTIPAYDSSSPKKWSFSKYSGLSASYAFFKGGSASVIAAPIGLQLNRRLTNNLYAFTGVSIAPAYINFNGAFLSADASKGGFNNSFAKTGQFGFSSRAELGLMYVNPERTFSISGSIGVERSSSPALFYNQMNNNRSNPVVSPNR